MLMGSVYTSLTEKGGFNETCFFKSSSEWQGTLPVLGSSHCSALGTGAVRDDLHGTGKVQEDLTSEHNMKSVGVICVMLVCLNLKVWKNTYMIFSLCLFQNTGKKRDLKKINLARFESCHPWFCNLGNHQASFPRVVWFYLNPPYLHKPTEMKKKCLFIICSYFSFL